MSIKNKQSHKHKWQLFIVKGFAPPLHIRFCSICKEIQELENNKEWHIAKPLNRKTAREKYPTVLLGQYMDEHELKGYK